MCKFNSFSVLNNEINVKRGRWSYSLFYWWSNGFLALMNTFYNFVIKQMDFYNWSWRFLETSVNFGFRWKLMESLATTISKMFIFCYFWVLTPVFWTSQSNTIVSFVIYRKRTLGQLKTHAVSISQTKCFQEMFHSALFYVRFKFNAQQDNIKINIKKIT